MIREGKATWSEETLDEIICREPRIEKIVIKDAKLRTFITSDSGRDGLVGHVYDVTYGAVQPTDNLVVIDDSIVRGTTLKRVFCEFSIVLVRNVSWWCLLPRRFVTPTATGLT